MTKFFSAIKKKALISAVAAGICFSGIFLPESAEAVEQFNIDWNGKTIFNIKYYGASDYTDSRAAFFKIYTPSASVLNYDLSSNLKSGLNKAFKWWAEILGPGANISQPAQYFVGTYNSQNADAISESYRNGVSIRNPTLFNEIFQSGQTVTQFNNAEDIPQITTTGTQINSTDDIAFGRIRIGQYLSPDILDDGNYGWSNAAYYASPTSEVIIGRDISAVMFHEIGHSLGISGPVKFTMYHDFWILTKKVLPRIFIIKMEKKQIRRL